MAVSRSAAAAHRVRRFGTTRAIPTSSGGGAAGVTPFQTHEVTNQSELYCGNGFGDPALVAAVTTYSPLRPGSGAWQRLSRYGAWSGSAGAAALAQAANTNLPKLVNFDRNGRRVDVVAYDPAYHALYGHATRSGVPSMAWTSPAARDGGHIARAALSLMHYQAESGTSCPLTMTFAAIPALRTNADAFQPWIERGVAPVYDPRNVSMEEKEGVVFGMSMTEKTGGSDVRSNTTTARCLDGQGGRPGDRYALTGHKWFTSAPMCDAFLTLAYVPSPAGASAPPALSCFLVPRWLGPGERNRGFRVVRLKEKLGDKSNASSEVEYDQAVGYLLGPVGKGVRTILDMVVHTRLDCALGSAGLMRQAVRNTMWYASHRHAFGSVLTKAGAMQALLADLSVESGVSVWMSMKMAALFQACVEKPDDGDLQALRRLATAVSKFYICKRCPNVVYEALEGIGGNGYVEEWDYARWFRQSPLNSVWEGSGNVMTLDIIRTCQSEPASLKSLLSYVAKATRQHTGLAAFASAVARDVQSVIATAAGGGDITFHARFLAETLALGLQAAVIGDALEAGVVDADSIATWWLAAHAAAAAGGGGEADLLPRSHHVVGAVSPAVRAHVNPPLAAGIVQRELDALHAGKENVDTMALPGVLSGLAASGVLTPLR